MGTQRASVMIKAPIEQVYKFWSHFNDYPKFMSFVKEVTYRDNENSHWVVDILGRHEWDARNENWIPNKRIGWVSTDGLKNSGTVEFINEGHMMTRVDVTFEYDPPAGVLGDVADAMGGGNRVQDALQTDLDHFAEMVEQAGPGALDPASSNYLYHVHSAASKGDTTERQDQSMQSNPSATEGRGLAASGASGGYGADTAYSDTNVDVDADEDLVSTDVSRTTLSGDNY